MDRMLAAYVAEYGQMPVGLMRTMAQHSVDPTATSPVDHAAGHDTVGHDAAGSAAAPSPLPPMGRSAPKYAGYVSPRDEEFIDRLREAESKPPSQRKTGRSPRSMPPLSPTVTGQGPPPTPPPPVHSGGTGTAASPVDEEATIKPAMPLPESGVLPRGAFMKSFEQLAESLGGRPF